MTASDDGSVFVHDVKDRDAKAAARREQVGSSSFLAHSWCGAYQHAAVEVLAEACSYLAILERDRDDCDA